MARILMRRVTWRSATPIVCENALVVSAVAAGAYIQMGAQASDRFAEPSFVLKAALIAAVCQLSLYFADLYSDHPVDGALDLMSRLLRSLAVTSLMLAALYLVFPVLILARGVIVPAVGLVLALVTAWRLGFGWLADRVGPRERLLMLGTRPAAVGLARELMARRRELGVELVGFVEPEPNAMRPPLPGPGAVGSIDDIPDIVRRHRVDRVVVSLEDARGRLPMDELLDMKLALGVRFDDLASVYEEYTGKIAVENLRPSWLIFSAGFRKPPLLRIGKRAVDVLVAVAGLVLGAPLLALVGAAVRLTSHGPALYHQRRTGQHGRVFTVHKFRTMRNNAEDGTGPMWARHADPRVTPIGSFLRRTRLDELPQLWNILVGDMSLVGPRPERPEFVTDLTRQIPFYGQRHVVKPGLTGWAQVRYTYGASVEDAMEKLQYDLFYIKNMSIGLDLLVMFSTVKTVIQRRGAR